MPRGLLFVISGPSGSGKTTVAGRLLASRQLRVKLRRSVSLTTRPKRPGEKDRRDYFFVSREEFRRQRKAKKILERTRYLGYDYATPRGFIDEQLKKGRNIVLCLDLKGVAAIRRLYPRQCVTIFVLPPSLDALRRRIKGRYLQTRAKELHSRLRLARQEMRLSQGFDYYLLNDNLERAVKELTGVVRQRLGLARSE
jgi:guanylate kinase